MRSAFKMIALVVLIALMRSVSSGQTLSDSDDQPIAPMHGQADVDNALGILVSQHVSAVQDRIDLPLLILACPAGRLDIKDNVDEVIKPVSLQWAGIQYGPDPAKWNPRSLSDNEKVRGLGIQVGRSSIFMPEDSSAPPQDPKFDKHDAYAMEIGSLGWLPVPGAELYSRGFIYGCVTRIMLGKLYDRWETQGIISEATNLDFVQLPSDPGTVLPPFGLLTDKHLQEILRDPRNHGMDHAEGTKSYLRDYLLTNPCEAEGILTGWVYAGEIADDYAKKVGDAPYNALLNLIFNRFSTKQIGEITAYTLDYLQGCCDIAQAHPDQASPPTAAIDTPTDRLVVQIETNLDAEAELASNPQSNLNGDELSTLKSLNKFKEGMYNGNERAFQDIAETAYDLGYHAGLKDGWHAGYSDGYSDGEASGFKEGWEQCSVRIAAAKAATNSDGFLSKLKSVVGTAQQIAPYIQTAATIFGS